MYRLSERQEEFCKLVAIYGVEPWQAAKEVGYKGHCRAVYMNVANRLLKDVHISNRIDELRDELFDLERVRRSIILEHQLTRMFNITEVMYPVVSYDESGEEYTRIVVRPMEDWPRDARRLCVGFDKFNRPIFKSKENATKELTRIFGLYKDNAVKDEEDTDNVLASSGLTPSGEPAGAGVDTTGSDEDEFDPDAFDNELGVDEHPEPVDEVEEFLASYEDDDYAE